ncbi:hypothetical protein D5086_009979 [Populus alba]|uniref:Uncharacterized protein n=1 Tax=Populus alba TaxID=43335 RepID=A0ACC4C979_POPAL
MLPSMKSPKASASRSFSADRLELENRPYGTAWSVILVDKIRTAPSLKAWLLPPSLELVHSLGDPLLSRPRPCSSFRPVSEICAKQELFLGGGLRLLAFGHSALGHSWRTPILLQLVKRSPWSLTTALATPMDAALTRRSPTHFISLTGGLHFVSVRWNPELHSSFGMNTPRGTGLPGLLSAVRHCLILGMEMLYLQPSLILDFDSLPYNQSVL